jgi:hypothetical protein
MIKWIRHRFRTFSVDDPRPVTFPPPGPYWITGEAGAGSYATIVAYFPAASETGPRNFWPDTDLDRWDGYSQQEQNEIEFTSRFAKPGWWTA